MSMSTPQSESQSQSYLHEAVEEALVDLGVRGLVHEACAHHVEGRHGAGHEEAGAEGGHELSGQAWEKGGW
jgi:hypothetical protein